MHSSLMYILIGAPVSVGAGGFAVYLSLTPGPTLTRADLAEVTGRISRIETVEGNRRELRLWLDDGEDPYCSSGPYPAEYPPDYLDRLKRAEAATITFRQSELESPRRNRSEGISFREMTSLTVDAVPLLTLDASNRWIEENHRMGRVVAPALAMFGACSLAYGVQLRRNADPRAREKRIALATALEQRMRKD